MNEFRKWLSKAESTYNQFVINIGKAKEVQNEILKKIIKKNYNTEFGKFHNLKSNDNYIDFINKIPINTYLHFEKWIEEIAEGKNNILTKENVLLFEPTSGSTSGTKLIPYTNSLKTEFQNGIFTWYFDILKQFPDIINGKQYWSITPATHHEKYTKSEIKIGFENDFEYFGWCDNSMFVVPEKINHVKTPYDIYLLTAIELLKTAKLTFISVWHPSLLIIIIDIIINNYNKLLVAIESGLLKLSNGNPLKIISDKKSAIYLSKINPENELNKIWPALQLISCWKDNYGDYIKLKKYFPNVAFQPKGLLATEAIISIPIFDAKGAIPAYSSHFIEFLNIYDGKVYLIDELERSAKYEIIITTGGGLYRYNLEDIIVVTDFYKKLPVIAFVGRINYSDLVGEKLSEEFVNEILLTTLKKMKIESDFLLFSPEINENLKYYTLFIEARSNLPDKINEIIDNKLRESYHYNYAREINQLQAVKVMKINNGKQKYFNYLASKNIKVGDIKLSILSKHKNLAEVFLFH